ncbi:hypothetical protein GCM10023168_23970 [Fodinibacter luteus]|uniref:PqqD family protein n=1 Tax=Fodinibacter luteus TaxID=552064 RepID=A0ABP8KIA0_9MICO
MRLQRREAIDVLERDGETVVLLGNRIVKLSELSAAIYALTQQPTELEQIARDLEARFGGPTDRSSLDATKDAVADLVHHGVLMYAG